MTAVQSSNLAAIDYDGCGTLTISFHGGGVYQFYNVPLEEYDSLMNASSPGRYFHTHLKNRYFYRKIAG